MDAKDTRAAQILAETGRQSLLTIGSRFEREALVENGGIYYWCGNSWSTSDKYVKQYKTQSALKTRLKSLDEYSDDVQFVNLDLAA
ncbi:MAG: hypothetical protein ACRC62_07410 [Microcoleus sp.]